MSQEIKIIIQTNSNPSPEAKPEERSLVQPRWGPPLAHEVRDIANARGNLVTIPARDLDVYEEMADVIRRLGSLAQRMNGLVTVDDRTREIIREVRRLAVELQSEMERRIG